METAAEIAIATAIQIGTLVWLLSGLKSDVKNLTGWVANLDKRQQETANLAAELKGRLEARPLL
jgi:hypothetical protein